MKNEVKVFLKQSVYRSIELIELLVILTEEAPLDATPVTVKNIGGRSVLFTEAGKRLSPEEAETIARRVFGYKR